MTASVQAEKTRGRPRGFDEDDVLDALTTLFRERGFEAASLTEIVEASGLNKSSLYNTFGSKDELFDQVLGRYMDMRESMFSEFMADGTLDALSGFLDMMRMELNSEEGCRGCLLVNASTELGLRSNAVIDMSSRYRKMMRDGVKGPLSRAEAAGEIAPGMVEVYADTVLSFSISASVAVRSGADGSEISEMIDSMARLVDSWRIADPSH